MNEQQQRFYEFGPFRLDPAGRQLFRGEERLTLTRKACGQKTKLYLTLKNDVLWAV